MTEPGVQNDPSDKDRAEDLVVRAWEEATPAGRRACMEEAVALDPLCVEALAFLAIDRAEAPDEAIAGLQEAVAAGETNLGPKAFEGDAGALWDLAGGRAYLRARTQLAQVLRETGQLPEALAHLLALLDQDVLDHFGNRYLAVAVALEQGDVDRVLEILDRFPDEGLAHTRWARVLLRFLTDGPAAAVAVLEEARAQNPHVEKRLLYSQPGPGPSSISPGGVSEAEDAVRVLAPAWEAHPRALDWLRAKCRTRDADELPKIIQQIAARVGGEAPDWFPAVFEDEDAVPASLVEQVQAFGADAAPWLLAVLQDDAFIPFDAVGGGYAPGHAAYLLGRLGVDETALPLVETLHKLEMFGAGESIVAGEVLDALLALGESAVEAVHFHLLVSSEEVPAYDSALHDVLADAGVKNDASLEWLVALLDVVPDWAAQLLERYGDVQALEPLHAALDTAPTTSDDGLPGNQAVLELCAAIESLGGRLSEGEEAKRGEVVRIRRRAMGGADEAP